MMEPKHTVDERYLEDAYERFKQTYNLTLNAQQEEALKRLEGNTLLLAVPGSGKTTVVISRIAFLIEAYQVDPKHILTLTFSKASAKDLTERFTRTFGTDRTPKFQTIHSFAYSAIHKAAGIYKKKPFDLLPDNRRFAAEVYASMKGYRPQDSDLYDILSSITYCKNLLLSEEEISHIKVQGIQFSEFYKRYERRKRELRVMDFDDLLIYAYNLLRKHKHLLSYYQNLYRYIHVDEAQDTSKIQHLIIEMLSKKSKALLMVGDEDQSIYGFRGAYPQGILDFEKRYPNAKVLLMETNYRSTEKLIEHADAFIHKNIGRYEKKIRGNREGGKDPILMKLDSQDQIYRTILESVRQEEKQTAVLYRNNESAIPLIDLFEREGISYRLKEHDPLFFSNFILRDFLDIYRFSQNQGDLKTFRRISYKLNSYLSKKIVSKLSGKGGNILNEIIFNPTTEDYIAERLTDVKRTLNRLDKVSATQAIDLILYDLGYQVHLDYQIKNGIRDEYVTQKLDIIRVIGQREKSLQSLLTRMNALREAILKKGKTGEGPLFTTIHSAKGLEFEKVIMIDVKEGILPVQEEAIAKLDQDSFQEYLEEVRLFYVGVTRAKDELIFLNTKGIPPYFDETSEFITTYMKNGGCKD